MNSISQQPKENQDRRNPAELNQQKLEAIEYAISALLAGPMFLIAYSTLPLQVVIGYIVFALGIALCAVAFVLVIYTWKDSLTPKAKRLIAVTQLRFILFAAALLSVAYTVAQMISTFGGGSWQSIISVVVAFIFLVLLIVSLIILNIRQFFHR